MAKANPFKSDTFLWSAAAISAISAMFIFGRKRAKGYEEISELASRKAAGETLSLAEETRLQAYIDEQSE